MEWTDGKPRCRWANPKNPAYIAYHDGEWGVPLHDDRALFELLILETFQAGLSWDVMYKGWFHHPNAHWLTVHLWQNDTGWKGGDRPAGRNRSGSVRG